MAIIDCVKYKNDYFILAADSLNKNNALWKYSGTKGTSEALNLLYPNDGTIFPFISLYEADGLLYFPPHNSNELLIYNIKENSFEHVAIDIPTINGKYVPKFYMGIIDYKKYLFFVGTEYSAVIKMDKMTHEFEICMAGNYCDKSDFFVLNKRGTACNVKNKIYLPINCDDMICIYDMDTDEYLYKRIGNHKNRYNTIINFGDVFWLSGYKNEIVMWNENEDKITIFETFPDCFSTEQKENENDFLFSKVELFHEKLYYAPLNANMVISFDINTGAVSKVGNIIEKGNRCYTIKQLNEGLLFLQIVDCNFDELYDIYVLKNGNVIRKDSGFSAKSFHKDFFNSVDMLYESSTYDLPFFVENISITNPINARELKDGKCIFFHLMEEN